MIRRIVSGYLGILRALVRVAILLAVCVGVGFLIVYPLWRLANSNSSLYSLIFALLAGALVIFLVGSQMRKSYRKNPKKFFLRLAESLILIAGGAAAVILVFAWQRLLAGIVLLIAFGLYGFLAFGLSSDSRTKTP